jgi:hypothetical protein
MAHNYLNSNREYLNEFDGGVSHCPYWMFHGLSIAPKNWTSYVKAPDRYHYCTKCHGYKPRGDFSKAQRKEKYECLCKLCMKEAEEDVWKDD